jgi:hypothetical protein
MRSVIYSIISFCLIMASCNHNESKSDFKCLMPYSEEQILNYNSEYSTKSYFPIKTFLDSNEIVNETTKKKEYSVKVDSFALAWYSSYLGAMKEPILYSKYLGKETYRFSWFRSFHPPVTITLEKEGNDIYLTTKMTNKVPELPFIHRFENGKRIKNTDTIYLVINERKIIKQEDFKKIRTLIDETNISCMSPKGISEPVVDGSEWIFEINNKEGYHYVIRWYPQKTSPLQQIGEYLIDLSAVKNEIRY